MSLRLCRIGALILREALSRSTCQRFPEPCAVMEGENAAAFHSQGNVTGPLMPIYHLNALATSRLIPAGGTLVDLGSGSGQYLMHLARSRPDIRIIGFDLSESMVHLGRQTLQEAGLATQVELRFGDMTSFHKDLPQTVDVISSVFALHHLPSTADLQRCLQEIALARKQHGCAVWLFDNVRPRHPYTAEVYPEVFTPEAPAAFRWDSRNSLIAAFSFEELSTLLDATAMEPLFHVQSRFMRLYQAHWLERQGGLSTTPQAQGMPETCSPQARRDFHLLRTVLLKTVPIT